MKKLKAVCGVLAVALAIFNYANGNVLVASYWTAVVAYWVFNYVGGKNDRK